MANDNKVLLMGNLTRDIELKYTQGNQAVATFGIHILRGGAYDANADSITTINRFRHEPDSAGLSRGFRCAENAK